jgi:hypothetical protein
MNTWSMVRTASAFAFTSLVVASPALAGTITPTPAPLIGAGIPALVAFAGGYAVLRRRRGK